MVYNLAKEFSLNCT